MIQSTNPFVELYFSDSDNVPNIDVPAIFLAGPSPRKETDYNWRGEAVKLFCDIATEKLILILPLPKHGIFPNYDEQVKWEQVYLAYSNVVMFWIPRDLDTLPGFTTNVEFGMYVTSPKTIYGRPDDAPKNRYLDFLFGFYQQRQIAKTLEETVKQSLALLNQ